MVSFTPKDMNRQTPDIKKWRENNQNVLNSIVPQPFNKNWEDCNCISKMWIDGFWCCECDHEW